MNEILTFLNNQVKNPLQWLFISVSLIVLLYIDKFNYEHILTFLITSLFLGYFFHKIWIDYKIKKEKKFALMNLNSYEKNILIQLFKNNQQSCDLDSNSPGICSLNAKKLINVSKMGNAENYIVSITISPEVWKLMQKNAHEIFDIIRIII